MSKTLEQLLNERSLRSQERIKALAQDLLLETHLYRVREALNLSQQELAAQMGIKQPSLSAIEKRGADVKLSTMKKYIEAMGGKLRIDVELPSGQHIEFQV